MFESGWWKLIPSRIDLRKANREVINNEVYAFTAGEIDLVEITDETLACVYLVAAYEAEILKQKDVSNSLKFELSQRAKRENSHIKAAFSIYGCTHEEMVMRVNRLHMNISSLQYIQRMSSSYDALGETSFDFWFVLETMHKFVHYLPDDELAELMIVADSELHLSVPAYKEILIEAWDRTSVSHT